MILAQELRYALRQLHRSPGVAAAALAALVPARRAASTGPMVALRTE